jgi:type I restriction enzyme S subunit
MINISGAVSEAVAAQEFAWPKRRLKFVADVAVSNVDKHSVAGEPEVLLCNYTDVYRNDFVERSIEFMASSASREQVRAYSLRRGDVVITKDSETPLDIAIPAIVKDSIPNLVCGYHLAIVRARENEIYPGFLFRVFQASTTRKYFATAANGITRFGLTQYSLKNIAIPVPPFRNQIAISEFLDRETAEADAIVAKYERLIELLEEKRVALITQAVTKGLDPSVSMKDSGVEWIGEIPEHWKPERLKWVASLQSGHTPDKKVPSYWENGTIPWVSLNDTGFLRNNDYIRETAYYTTAEGIANSSAHLLPAGTVIFSRDATIGRCAISEIPMAVSQHFIAWICGQRITPLYLLHCCEFSE